MKLAKYRILIMIQDTKIRVILDKMKSSQIADFLRKIFDFRQRLEDLSDIIQIMDFLRQILDISDGVLRHGFSKQN